MTLKAFTCFSNKQIMHTKFNWINIKQPSLFQNTNLMHNSFIFQQYIRYTTILNMFRAARCSSSGGQIVSPQPLVSSPSVSSHTVYGWRADCSPLSTRILYGCLEGWRYQRLWWYKWSSWWWAACCSKHVEDRSVTYTGCFTTLGHSCRRWFPRSLWSKKFIYTCVQFWTVTELWPFETQNRR